jgi:hypothetical protein
MYILKLYNDKKKLDTTFEPVPSLILHLPHYAFINLIEFLKFIIFHNSIFHALLRDILQKLKFEHMKRDHTTHYKRSP